MARHFAGEDLICVVLGDNILEKSIAPFVRSFLRQGRGAKILLKKVPDPQRFGVPELNGDRVVRITEKPSRPASPYAVTGVYMYDRRVFDIIDTLSPSERGELEITDVNNRYIESNELTYNVIDGWWTDAGTIESLMRAANLVSEDAGAPARLEVEMLANS